MRIVLYVISVLTSLIILTFETNAQSVKSKYGVDSTKCVTNLSLYRTYYKQKNYKEALTSWRYVFNNCPGATENIFINGANMYKSFIENQNEPLLKNRLIDTLMQIYDLRIKYYGNEGRNLANKATDLLFMDSTRSYEAFGMLKRSVDLLKNNADESSLLNYNKSAVTSFKSGKISNTALVEIYNQTDSIISSHLSNSTLRADSLKWIRTRTFIESNTVSVLQCKDISEIYRKQLEASPNDLNLLKKILGTLNRRGCTDDTLYFSSLEKMNGLEPDINTAVLIAREYVKRKDVSSALMVLNGILDKVKDDASKARCYYYLGVVYADSKDYIEARSNALKTIQIKADFGEAYLLIADCYAQSAPECGKDDGDVAGRAAFWCAVDVLNKAKKMDPKIGTIANNLIKQYSQNFPTTKMLLLKDLKIGSKYKVDCWINETTTIRASR